jgi:hypothetical protein
LFSARTLTLVLQHTISLHFSLLCVQWQALIINRYFDMKQILWTIVILVAFLVLLWLGWISGVLGENGGVKGWNTYTNNVYGFELQYPKDWVVGEFPDSELGPIFNVYPANLDISTDAPPFTHHSDVSVVSVFPLGIPMEGIFGMSTTSMVAFSDDFLFSVDFSLLNGDVWATAAGSDNPPMSWSEAGFVWARASVSDMSIRCTRNGEDVNEDDCDPYSGDMIIRSGAVDRSIRAIEEKILESIHFIPSTNTQADFPGDPIDGLDYSDVIHVFEPQVGSVVRSPLNVSGEARGTWFFEATFPLALVDEGGSVIAQGYATADGDWMTEDFVPFTGEIEFVAQDELGQAIQAVLVLSKANPSGLPELDADIRVPVELLFE